MMWSCLVRYQRDTARPDVPSSLTSQFAGTKKRVPSRTSTRRPTNGLRGINLDGTAFLRLKHHLRQHEVAGPQHTQRWSTPIKSNIKVHVYIYMYVREDFFTRCHNPITPPNPGQDSPVSFQVDLWPAESIPIWSYGWLHGTVLYLPKETAFYGRAKVPRSADSCLETWWAFERD